jgi:hypothetical protein
VQRNNIRVPRPSTEIRAFTPANHIFLQGF